ncbi:MAG TPA: hypothetical protein PKE27_01490 [Povalibacter sp.]|uniref:hypothetical protein n=1 Tax=Povalibacter sp. TaxID=1962978 RepID=UPI002C3E194C|nr:hypothetical protein [Povalibacter sp.]HMN43222.1 hypothetical protein [Povalibacter sp.]
MSSRKSSPLSLAFQLAFVLLAVVGVCRAEPTFADASAPATFSALFSVDSRGSQREEKPSRTDKVCKQRIREFASVLAAPVDDTPAPASNTCDWSNLAGFAFIDSCLSTPLAAPGCDVRVDRSPRLQLKLQLGQAP